MTIHTVQAGETLNSIAAQYGISRELIIAENELPNPDRLLIGQNIGIRIPSTTHTVVQGDTLNSVAEQYNTTVTSLYQHNPRVAVTRTLTPGQLLVISYADEEPVDTVIINGFAYPFIEEDVLRQTLPFLTFLYIFTYGFTPNGELVPIEDEEVIAIGEEYNVSPVMMLAPMTADGNFDTDVAHQLFNNPAGQTTLIDNIINNMRTKGYVGLDIDFEFVLPEDRQGFIDFITNVHTRLSAEGYFVSVNLAPKTSGTMTGLLYEAHDYPAIGAIADRVMLMTYEWGYTYGPPMATAPVNNVRRVLEYGVSVIDPDKIIQGLPNYAYDWPLPFVRGETAAENITNQQAITRGVEFGVEIQFDQTAQCPFYYYTTAEGIQHVVWFDDVKSMSAKIALITEFGLAGGGIWQIMNYFPGLWMVVDSSFNIIKV